MVTRECEASKVAGARLTVRAAHDLGWVPSTGMAPMQQELWLRPGSHGKGDQPWLRPLCSAAPEPLSRVSEWRAALSCAMLRQAAEPGDEAESACRAMALALLLVVCGPKSYA